MSSPRLGPRHVASIGLFALGLTLVGCGGPSADVVLYCAVDAAHSEPIVRAFEQATGLRVRFQPDVELSKSVGHRRSIQEEASNPRCDVFWNNEVVQTVLLGDAGFLQPYDSPAAADIPEQFRDPERLWTGFGARARVLIVNTDAFPDPAQRPDSTHDFLDEAFAGRACMARPLTGTTAAHGAVWIQDWGLPRMLAQLDRMRKNGVAFGDSNGRVMRLVRKGDLDFGFTDTDDVKKAIDDNFPVVQVVPDQAPGEMGLIVIPNTVSMVKGAPHPEAARRLIDYLLSHAVEEALAHGASAQIPLRPQVPRPDDVLDLSSWRLAPINWPAIGRAYAEHVDALETYFNK
jgi:iron(III) transport system substrate-binding protein